MAETSKVTNNFGLQPGEIEEIKAVFAAAPKIKEVKLFGSRALGTFKNGSDIDFAIIGDNIILDDILMLKLHLEELGMLYKFDILTLNEKTPPEITGHIARAGVTFYSRK